MPSSNLRVVVACVTFETVMVVEPVKHYKADRVYLLHQARKEPYTDFLNEVEAQLTGSQGPHKTGDKDQQLEGGNERGPGDNQQ